MLTDEVTITIAAGKGGDGLVTFDKAKMSLGPTGGRGGDGGDVYFEGVTNLTALNKFKGKKDYWAEDGERGRANRSDGPRGEDITLTVPVGTLIQVVETGEAIDITKAGQRVLMAKGGFGGRGNFFFRSPRNTTPLEYEEGKPGQAFSLRLELRLIADIGLIGFPNAGKSSLLNELTKADIKVADYPFTTLEPNLGSLGSIIIADIPGLIEDAHKGKGLGIKFLRHIERTKALAHCISLESDDVARDYKIIWNELKSYKSQIVQRKEMIVLTKSDLVSPEAIEKKKKTLKKLNPDITVVSIHDFSAIEELRKKFLSFAESDENGIMEE